MSESPDIPPISDEELAAIRATASQGIPGSFGTVERVLARLDAAEAHLADVEAERDRYAKVLERIHGLPSGAIPGHAVAVGCRHNIVAWKALNAPNEVECPKCDGRGYTMDYGPWKYEGGNDGRFLKVGEERDPNGISYGKQAPCDCDAGWLNPQETADGRD